MDERETRRVLAELRALRDGLPTQEHRHVPVGNRAVYDALVKRAAVAIDEDLDIYLVSDDMVTTVAELSGLGRHVGGLSGPVLAAQPFRSLLGRLIARIETDLPQFVSAAAKPESSGAVQVFVNAATGGVWATAVGGRDVSMQFTVTPGDIASLLEGLRGLDVSSEHLDQLESDLRESEEAPAGVVWRWFGKFLSDSSSGAAGELLGRMAPAIATTLAAFLGFVAGR